MMQSGCNCNAKASPKNCICIHMTVTVIVTFLDRWLSSQEQGCFSLDSYGGISQ